AARRPNVGRWQAMPAFHTSHKSHAFLLHSMGLMGLMGPMGLMGLPFANRSYKPRSGGRIQPGVVTPGPDHPDKIQAPEGDPILNGIGRACGAWLFISTPFPGVITPGFMRSPLRGLENCQCIHFSTDYDSVPTEGRTKLQRLPFTEDEIMADCVIQSLHKTRFIRRGLMAFGWLIAVVMVYVASIGPLAWLDSRGFGSDETWKQLHKTVYRPIFHAWWYGPRWIGSSLGWYTELFAGSSGRCWKGGSPPYFTKRYNDLCRNVGSWRRFQSGELAEGQVYDPLAMEMGVFGWDVLLVEHAEKEFQ
ncbi:MAG: hypothetical protein JWN70_3185, partial [Planctomycetaceae bacterium]|nr:hypothetical protein [Planctomycetaceae bacterium]